MYWIYEYKLCFLWSVFFLGVYLQILCHFKQTFSRQFKFVIFSILQKSRKKLFYSMTCDESACFLCMSVSTSVCYWYFRTIRQIYQDLSLGIQFCFPFIIGNFTAQMTIPGAYLHVSWLFAVTNKILPNLQNFGIIKYAGTHTEIRYKKGTIFCTFSVPFMYLLIESTKKVYLLCTRVIT